MDSNRAHKHRYDLDARVDRAGFVVCTVCGFCLPLKALASKVNLDAITARRHATQAVREALGER